MIAYDKCHLPPPVKRARSNQSVRTAALLENTVIEGMGLVSWNYLMAALRHGLFLIDHFYLAVTAQSRLPIRRPGDAIDQYTICYYQRSGFKHGRKGG